MIRLSSFVALQKVPSVFLNALQDRILGLLAGNQNNDIAALSPGADVRAWQTTTSGISANNLSAIDTSKDWRDHWLWGHAAYVGGGGSVELPGQTSDHLAYSGLSPKGVFTFCGYTGIGGYRSVSPLAQVNAGNPPVVDNTSSSQRSNRVNIDTSAITYTPTPPAVYLYADGLDGTQAGALKIYNATGSTQRLTLVVFGVKLGKR